MMSRWLISVLTFGSLLAAAAGAQVRHTPEMPDNIAQYWKRIAKAKTITYTVKEWGPDLLSDAAPGRSIFCVWNTYEVKVQRPNRLSISTSPGVEREVTENGHTHKEFGHWGEDVYINNGKQSITYSKQIHYYRIGKGLDALGKDNNGHELRDSTNWLFDELPMVGYRVVPESLAESSTTVIYVLTDPKLPNRQQKIYFDRKTGNLIQTSDFKDDKGTLKETRRQEFRFWDFDVRLPADTFSVRPPRTYITEEEFKKMNRKAPADTATK
jgi:outer membrane lipoprotein-sorting protein